MKTSGTICWAIYFLGLAGALLFTLLLVHEGAGEVLRAVTAAGWWLALISALHLLPLSLDSFEWWILFPKRDRLPLRTVVWARFLGESVSNLVAAAQVGGDLVRARLAVLKGAPLAVATATVLVDITASVFAQTFFTVLGLSLLIVTTGRIQLIGPVLAGAPLALGAVGGFYIVQRLGMFRLFGFILSRCAHDPRWRSLSGKGGELDQTLRQVYARKRAVAVCESISNCNWRPVHRT